MKTCRKRRIFRVRRGARGTSLLLGAVLVLAPGLFARQAGAALGSQTHRLRPLTPGECTRIADPKLDGGRVDVAYFLEPTAVRYDVTITVFSNAGPVATLFHGKEAGSQRARRHSWDGRDSNGRLVDPGSYFVRVEASNGVTWSFDEPIDLVRLGITRLGALSSDPTTTDEWPLVYFMKDGAYEFYATPSLSEFVSKAAPGEISDLDLDDGSPRPPPPVWTTTDAPVTVPDPAGGSHYDTRYHNYPLCYHSGASPRFEIEFGSNCTTSSGRAHDCNYPVSGFEIRCVASDQAGDWSSSLTDLHPGDVVDFSGPTLPAAMARVERDLDCRFQYREVGSGTSGGPGAWQDVPGWLVVNREIYATLQPPQWTWNNGVQYLGPWVWVLSRFIGWANALGIAPTTSDETVEVFIKGFFGQNSGIATAIEGVEYDCPVNGGDGGATHYLSGSDVYLTKLINNHALGIYVNCTDCAALSSTMLTMLGVPSVQMELLGSMTLRDIWGIGCPGYTLDVWSNGGGPGHSFNYHHIITRDAGTHVSDACLCVDEDGDADHTPGTPGWNHDRSWSSYESLLATGSISWQLDILPNVK